MLGDSCGGKALCIWSTDGYLAGGQGEMASIAIGSDNAAFEPKDVLVEHLREGGPGAVLLTRRYRFWSAARG